MKKYYLAYGSNLNIAQMRFRCPDARVVGTAVIENYELLFKGSQSGAYLTIEPKDGARVPVGVWEVSENDIKRLDLYEGYPRFYYRKDMKIALKPTKGRSRTVDAFVYIMHEDRPIARPAHGYVSTCLEGYDNFGFKDAYLVEAFRKSLQADTKEREEI